VDQEADRTALARTRVQLVEEAYRAWNAGGPRAFVEFTTDDVAVHDAPELPDAQEWIGRKAVVARLEDVVAATGGRWADIEAVRPVADEVLVSLTWRLDREGPAVLASVYHVVRVEADRIARVRVFLDEEAALRAAEL
jgi:ketosteroid isomerase-like protein